MSQSLRRKKLRKIKRRLLKVHADQERERIAKLDAVTKTAVEGFVSVEAYGRLVDELEDAEDRLSVYEATGDTVSLEEVEKGLEQQREDEDSEQG